MSKTAAITSGLANLNPFSKKKDEDEDKGEAIGADSVGGGGHASRKSKITKSELRVSRALKSLLAHEGVISEKDAEGDPSQISPALKELLDRSHLNVPPEVTDRSHPLPEYFISSSHNTYLIDTAQLYGTANANAYQTALMTGSRCVEIDAWDGEDKQEPKVTHGLTLSSNIPFRKVCETMRDVVDKEAAEAEQPSGYRAAPILLSLENHCSAEGQQRLVQIMREVWGDRLLSKRVSDQGTAVTLDQLGSKIGVIVEYYFGTEPAVDEAEEEDPEENEQEKQDRAAYEKKKKAVKVKIIPELAELGVYAQSVKPRDNSWFEAAELKDGPHDHLINISESGLGAFLPVMSEKIAKHNSKYLMRVFPKGTRINSENLHPVPFWGIGAQICAMNWQNFGASMQLNEALFAGTDGYVLKPEALRAGGSGKLATGKKIKLKLRVEGATDLPVPKGRKPEEIRPYVTCTLYHPSDLKNETPKRKTSPYKQHKLGIIHKGLNPPPTNPIFNETLEWEYEDSELAFLRILVKSDDKFAANPVFAVAAVRLQYVSTDWSFIRLLDLGGRETRSTLLVKFEFEDA